MGGGESGVGAAILAKKIGEEVFLSDSGKVKDKYRKVLSDQAIRWEEGQHSLEEMESATLVVKSPGIPDSAAMVQHFVQKGVPVVSEIEFAARHTNAKLVAITGSNGKTTTTLLIHYILKNAGLKVGLAGNVGKSFARQVAEEDFDHYVLELSSFQLDGIVDFRPHIALLLNITPDHLDRYDGMAGYRRSKFRITMNQGPEDVFIHNLDDAEVQLGMKERPGSAKTIAFSLEQQLPEGAYLIDNTITVLTNKNQFNMSVFELALQGRHNVYNSMAAGIAARVLELKNDVVRASLSDFQNIEHRLEPVATVHGIEFINDSKATNVNSTWYALESMSKPVIWIVGGVDKGNKYSQLKELVQQKVKGIICLGSDNDRIIRAFKKVVPEIQEAGSAQEAVKLAYDMARSGEAVLLSPACASFDLFQDFEDRGNQFKNAVKAL